MNRLKIITSKRNSSKAYAYLFILSSFASVLAFVFLQLTNKYSIHLSIQSKIVLTALSSLIFFEILFLYLFSKSSPIKVLALRAKLKKFTQLLVKKVEYGNTIFTVEWRYQIKDSRIRVELYSDGLIEDKSRLGKQLSEYLRMSLISFTEEDYKSIYTFGKQPPQLNGLEILDNEEI